MSQRRSAKRATRRSHHEVLWLVRWVDIPFNHVLDELRAHVDLLVVEWQKPSPREWEWSLRPRLRSRRATDRDAATARRQGYGREIPLRRSRDNRDYPVTVTLVSPRLLWKLLRAPQDVVVSLEMNAATLYAVMSKVRPRRRVVVLFEGDVNFLGATGTTRAKVWLRRLMANFVDVFVANSSAATAYLVDAIGVDRGRIVEGWWLAGLPPSPATDARPSADGPVFVTVGQLIPRKGIDLLVDAVAAYRAEHGPCLLRIVGDGPERGRLSAQAERLGIQDSVEFVGPVPHSRMGEILTRCDLFVFPTLQDLIGRVVVEALSVGTPVAVSRHSGAADTLVREGHNGVIMDPRDPASLLDALRRGAERTMHQRIRAGARTSGDLLTPAASARVIAAAVDRARTG